MNSFDHLLTLLVRALQFSSSKSLEKLLYLTPTHTILQVHTVKVSIILYASLSFTFVKTTYAPTTNSFQSPVHIIFKDFTD